MNFDNNENENLEQNTQSSENINDNADTQENITEPQKVTHSAKIYYENMIPSKEENQEKNNKPKKQRLLNTPIIIAACTLLVAILCFLVYYFFFDNSIYGTWTFDDETSANATSTADEADKVTTYYTFNSDGTATASFGTVIFKGTVKVTQKADGTASADIEIPQFVSGTFNVAITGNKLMTRHLVLSNDSANGSFTSATESKATLEKYKDFKSDDDIIGTWSDSDTGISYTFNKDGTALANQSDSLIINYVYTVDKDKGTISVKYIHSKTQEDSLQYSYDKDKDTLVIEGLGFKRGTVEQTTAEQTTVAASTTK